MIQQDGKTIAEEKATPRTRIPQYNYIVNVLMKICHAKRGRTPPIQKKKVRSYIYLYAGLVVSTEMRSFVLDDQNTTICRSEALSKSEIREVKAVFWASQPAPVPCMT